MIVINEKLLARIDELCEERNTNKRQLQIRLGMGQGSIAKWKRSAPSIATLQKIADYFRVSLGYLQGETDFRNTKDMLDYFDSRYQPKTGTEMTEVDTSEGVPSWYRQDIIEIAELASQLDQDNLELISRMLRIMLQMPKSETPIK